MPICTFLHTNVHGLKKGGEFLRMPSSLTDDDEVSTPKETSRKGPRKHKRKAVLAVEGTVGKKSKTSDTGKQIAVCTSGQVAAGEKT